MAQLPRRALAYVLAVCVAGIALLAMFVSQPFETKDWGFAALLVLGAILGEVKPIKVPIGAEGMEITVSTTFGYALLLEFGPAHAAVAMVAAVVIADLRAGKAVWKLWFNAAQYVLAVGAAAWAIGLVGDPPSAHVASEIFTRTSDVAACAVGALAFFATNVLVLGIALAAAQQVSVFRVLRRDFAYQSFSNIALLALGPIAVVVGDRSLLLLPALLFPLAAAYRSALISLENEHQALHDSLTGLPNRSLFRRRAADALDDGAAMSAVMLIDLDRFKEINDTLGHHTGDFVLQALGPRLGEAVGPNDTVARLGGDEFGVVLAEVASAAEAEEVAHRLLMAIRRPITLRDIDLEVDASIGIALSPVDGTDADALIQHADIAMYAAKDEQCGFQAYDSSLDHTSPVRLTLIKELRRAIEQGDLLVYHQPKIDVATGRPTGSEALVRWPHPTRGMIPPDDFIGLAEQTGLIGDLTIFVLRQAVASCRDWQAIGFDLTVSVNVSARSLHDLRLPGRVKEILDEEGVDPSRLVLEITESTVMTNVERSIAQLGELRALGVSISLDDYGTGHSSLAQLKHLPIDELKIDRSFITFMTEDSDDALIAASTIDLARRLGKRVVAEGVETEAAYEHLKELGCHLAQGYLFSPPLPADEFAAWLCAQRRPVDAEHPFPAGDAVEPATDTVLN